MDPAFWRSRWQDGRIAFHEGRPNSYLERHADQLAGRRRVFVPLCGKTEDLAFLASQGHEVIGVELVEDAVRAFFSEHQITPAITQRGELVEFAAPPITLLAGDFFATSAETLGAFDAIYDRAALVALPEDLRTRYVAHLRALAPPGTRIILLAFEYDQSKMSGPPFSVDEHAVRQLYKGAAIEVLSFGADARIRETAPPCVERCFSITLR